MSSPIPFDGPAHEARENYDSHWWWTDSDGQTVCDRCLSKPWHAAALYPCGVEPPRSDDPALVRHSVARFAAYAALVER